MDLAVHVGKWSKDRNRQVGCAIVSPENAIRAIGFNGFPRGLEDDLDNRHRRPEKYLWTEHAERNAIYAAAWEGIALRLPNVFGLVSLRRLRASDCTGRAR